MTGNYQKANMFKELPKVIFIVMVFLWFFDSKPNLTKKDNEKNDRSTYSTGGHTSCGNINQKSIKDGR